MEQPPNVPDLNPLDLAQFLINYFNADSVICFSGLNFYLA